MTRRYTSGFDILGFDTDPTPGDPDIIMSQIVPTYQSIGDDAEAALNALNSNAIENGAGQTMQALQNLIGTSFPPKLQTAADSYHSAASIYSAYAQALTEAQNQLDRAMDQAVPVAAMANATVPPAPPNASADQVAAVQQQQQSVDQANDQLTAAKQLGQDAQDMRTQAGNTFNTNLNDVSAIPPPTPPSWWQDFVNFFNDKFVQIFVDIAIAVTSIFCPVVGLALGAVLFGLSTAINISSGHFDAGAFVVGLLTLAVGVGVAKGLIDVVKISAAVSKVGAAAGSFISKLSGTAAKGIGDSASAVADASGSGADAAGAGANAAGKLGSSTLGNTVKSFGKSFAGNFAFNSVTGLAGKGIGDAIDKKPFNWSDVGAIEAGAAAGGVVGGAFSAGKTALGLDPVTPSPGSSGSADTSDGPLPPLPGGSQDGPLPPLPGDTNKPLPLPGWAGAAFNQAGRVGNDVANAGVEIAVAQAIIPSTTNHQADPAGQQANAYGYSDLPALAVGDLPALAPFDDLGASDVVIEPVEGE